MKKFTWFMMGFALFFISCEFQSYEEYRLPKYDGRLKWEQVVKSADWENRYDHASVVFKGKMWVVGGYNPGEYQDDTYYEDVWSSSDGIHWTEENASAPFKGRRGHALVVFNDGSQDAMFLIGGYSVNENNGYREYRNDVWKSADGINWTEIKVQSVAQNAEGEMIDWYPRMNHSCVVAEHGGSKYIYLLGGYTQVPDMNGRYSMKYFNDVWRSTNGVSWEKVLNNDYGIRAEQACAVDPLTNTIYMQGGSHGILFDAEIGTSHPFEEWHHLWSSTDGQNWTPSLDTTFNESLLWRVDHQMIEFEGMIWFLPGKNNNNVHYHFTLDANYAIWLLDEHRKWQVDSEGEAFDARHSYTALVFQDKLWILGGMTNRNGQANDVWSGQLK